MFQVMDTGVDAGEGRGYRRRIQFSAIPDELIRILIHKPHRKAPVWIRDRECENVRVGRSRHRSVIEQSLNRAIMQAKRIERTSCNFRDVSNGHISVRLPGWVDDGVRRLLA